VQTKERKGRRRITTKEQDEAIVAMATQHPLTAAKYVAAWIQLERGFTKLGSTAGSWAKSKG